MFVSLNFNFIIQKAMDLLNLKNMDEKSKSLVLGLLS